MPSAPLILARPPSPRLAEGELRHLDRAPVDAVLARAQRERYVAASAARGWDVVDRNDGPAPDELAVLTSPGAVSRRGELTSPRGR